MEPADSFEYNDAPRVNAVIYPQGEGTPLNENPTAFPGEAAPPSRTTGWGSAARELVETVLLTLVIFFMIRFAIENYRIEGYSMEPNFHDGQFLLVNKINYLIGHPQRGDVIVFRYPYSQPNNPKNYIKRIIGLPGEKVQVTNGKVYVNDVRMDEPFPFNHAAYDWGPVTVGPDEYFVLGDNRPESSDSHSWGLLPARNIIGKAWVSYWPPQEWGVVNDYSYAAAP